MKKIVVLDLDETLIYARKNDVNTYDFKVGDFLVNKRSYLNEFLSFCNENFEVIIWTSSSKNYAEEIVHNIMDEKNVSILLSREDCVQTRDLNTDEIVWIKDLKKLKRKGYCLDNILVIDDSPEKLQRNYGNLIRIKPFYGDADDELLLLQKYLETILHEVNFRKIEKRNWRNKISSS